jgi:hypothetical protein
VDLHLNLLRVVLVMFVMIALAHGLRRAGFFKDDHGAVFTTLVKRWLDSGGQSGFVRPESTQAHGTTAVVSFLVARKVVKNVS